jgi:hypothetical protein
MLEEVARITPATLYVHPTQGSYRGGATAASAGTHDGGGVVDIRTRDLDTAERNALLVAMRKVGFAAWLRHVSQGFEADHCHAVAVQPGGRNDKGVLSTGAHNQVKEYYDNYDGLAGNRHDDGPRTWVGVTWESYNHRTTPAAHEIAFPGTVRRGSTGNAVKAWQAQMIAKHFIPDTPSNHDGVFGAGMESAAKDMQRALHVTVDGICGSVTWTALGSHH